MTKTKPIQRLIVKAKPTKGHPEFREWETSSLVVFVAEDNKAVALAKVEAELHRRHWQKLYYESKSTLIRNRAKRAGGEFWSAYKSAERDGIYFRVFPDNFSPGRKGLPPVRAPRVTEAFMDRVIDDIGGSRLNTNDQYRTTDYLIEDWLFELKDLQEEGLDQVSRQSKLAGLFCPYYPEEVEIELDPDILSEEDRKVFLNIMGSPIQSQVKSAAKQIKSTRSMLSKPELKGGIIYLNTGYGTLPPDIFEQSVERYVSKDSEQIDAVICISTWSLTNGLNSEAHYKFYPTYSNHSVIDKMFEAFNKRFEEAMTKTLLGKLSGEMDLSQPLKSSGFVSDGIQFYWQPPRIPREWMG